MRRRSVLVITALGLIGLPAAPAAAAALPTLGAAEGVTATLTAGHVELRLSGTAATAAARYVGRTLNVECTNHPRPGLLFAKGAGTSSSGSSAPVVREADGTLVVAAQGAIEADVPLDVCWLQRPDGPRRVVAHHDGIEETTSAERPPLARAAVTPAGALWLQELADVSRLYDVLIKAQGHGTHPLPATLTALQPDVVALDGPDASPPPGQVGYWSDGVRHTVLATVTATGRRMVEEDLGDGMLRSNVEDFGSDYAMPEPATEIYLNRSDADPDGSAWHPGKPVGEADGIRATAVAGRLTVRFGGRAAAAFRRIAGRRVSVTCSGARTIGLFTLRALQDAIHVARPRAPRHGGVLRTPIAGVSDLCAITDDGHTIATATPTAAGNRLEADFLAIVPILSASEDVGVPAGATTYPPAATIAKRIGHGAVALSGPDAPLARGHVGVWTDGAQRAALATTSATGRRMVWADDGDGILRSNVFSAFTSAFVLASFE
jgi:hypothetical protein